MVIELLAVNQRVSGSVFQRLPIIKGSRINLNFIFQEQHPDKLEVACQDKLVVCLPEASSVRTDLGGLDSDFFDLHILREKVEEGWYSSINPSLPLIAELQESNLLKLFSGNFTVCNNVCLLKIGTVNIGF